MRWSSRRRFSGLAVLIAMTAILGLGPGQASAATPSGAITKICQTAWPGIPQSSQACAILYYDASTNKIGVHCTVEYELTGVFTNVVSCALDEDSYEQAVASSSDGEQPTGVSGQTYTFPCCGVRNTAPVNPGHTYAVKFVFAPGQGAASGPVVTVATPFATIPAPKVIRLVHGPGGPVAQPGDAAQIGFTWRLTTTFEGKEVEAYCEGTDPGGHVVGPNLTSTAWKIYGSKKDLPQKFCGTGPVEEAHQTNGSLRINTITVKAAASGTSWTSSMSLSSAVEVQGGCKYQLTAVKSLLTEEWGEAMFGRGPGGEVALQKNTSQPPGCPPTAKYTTEVEEVGDLNVVL